MAQQRCQQTIGNHRAAMNMKFAHVLASKGVRRRKVKAQSKINDVAIGITEGAVMGSAWLGEVTAYQLTHRRTGGTREAEYADTTLAGRSGERTDGVGSFVHDCRQKSTVIGCDRFLLELPAEIPLLEYAQQRIDQIVQ